MSGLNDLISKSHMVGSPGNHPHPLVTKGFSKSHFINIKTDTFMHISQPPIQIYTVESFLNTEERLVNHGLAR